jgi:hypothetical protein
VNSKFGDFFYSGWTESDKFQKKYVEFVNPADGATHAVVVEVLLLAPVSDSLELLAGGPPQVSAAC